MLVPCTSKYQRIKVKKKEKRRIFIVLFLESFAYLSTSSYGQHLVLPSIFCFSSYFGEIHIRYRVLLFPGMCTEGERGIGRSIYLF